MLGQTLSHFRITAKLGEGGMGEVYRATDSTLGREVAIKILPLELARDKGRLARFEREARVLASLNHPRIAGIYEVGRHEDTRFLVMELVDGETLAERMERGRVAAEEALPLALQVAEGLEQAHEQGIVHRDLKPANVMVGADGGVKILDFGLARAWADPIGPEAGASEAPTVTAPMTRAGVILGTAAYMSPEQAAGEEVDKRSDIWAFGVVLEEMLSGARLFRAPSVSATLAAVLRDPIPLDRLPSGTPDGVKLLVTRCLERDRTRRLRDIGEARIALESAISSAESSPPTVGAASALSLGGRRELKRRRWWLGGLVAVAAAVLTLATIWRLTGPAGSRPAVARLVAALPSGQQLMIGNGAYPMALSADAERLAYVAAAGGEPLLFVRSLDSFDSRPIRSTEGAYYPFFSPDGEWLGFFAEGQLKKVPMSGGPPMSLCAAEATRGASWAPDGFIYFSDRDSGGGLQRVSAAGGALETVRTGQKAFDESIHYYPYALPDGSGLITHSAPRNAGRSPQPREVALLDFESHEWRLLGEGSQAQYVDPGFLLLHTGRGEIRAVPFDLESHAIRGQAVPVLEGVYRAPNFGGAFFAASRNGTLVYVPGGFERELRRVTRDGRQTPLTAEVRGFRLPRISPDGRRLAVVVDPRPSELWIYDLETGARSRLAGEGHNLVPVWSPDGRRVTYSSAGDIVEIPADGSGGAEPLLQVPGAQFPGSWSPDGRQLTFWDNAKDSADIWVYSTDGDSRPIVATPFDEWNVRISPDGRWMAYQSTGSGRLEVFVRSFPDGRSRQTISTRGGRDPVWAADGRELFYDDGEAVYRVPLGSGSTLEPGLPELLFTWPHGLVHGFDVFPDGESFVLVKTDPDSAPDSFRVVLHWSRELEERFSRGER